MFMLSHLKVFIDITIYKSLYILPISNRIFISNNNIVFYVTTKEIYKT